MGESNPAPTRRAMLGVSALLLSTPLHAADEGYNASGRSLAAMEKRLGLRIGVAALDTGNGNSIFYRESERFLMCSTFKVMLVAAVLTRVDAGKERLERVIRYQKSDLLEYAPETSKNLARGMSVGALCAATVTLSDNTAANLLFADIGGPPGLTSFARDLGDSRTRFDRTEGALNVPDGERDTTVPSAMLANLRDILLGDTLSSASRKQLTDWMTGLSRLRAGLPAGWKAGDKTGSGAAGALNDIAILWPPAGRAPVLVCAYTDGNRAGDAPQDRALAEIGGIVAARFA
ncbi:MAG: class A beta-lactamase [Alphaproteobacteria bacterium]|nr:class A beta-lactamase [Alphaproteobacteria bacterium]